MEIDLPEVVAEVRAEFDRYEKALGDNDVAAAQRDLLERSAHHPLWRHRESLRPRMRSRRFVSPACRPVARTISRTVISTYGRDHAVASTLFHRASVPGKVGRQMQTWVRFPQGWRVVAAHVSFIDDLAGEHDKQCLGG